MERWKDRTDSTELSSDLPMYPQYTYHTQRDKQVTYLIYIRIHTHHKGRHKRVAQRARKGIYNSYCTQKADSLLNNELLYTSERITAKIEKNYNK